MSNKNAILISISSDLDKNIFNYTKSNFEYYANKINAELIIKENNLKQFNLFELLGEYDRIIYFNPNILIRNDCPNLFDITPEEKIGLFNEAPYINRTYNIQNAQYFYNMRLEKWNGKYYNTDVIIASLKHKLLFYDPRFLTNDIQHNELSFDHYLNLRLNLDKIKIHDLYLDYNRLHFVDEKIGISRFDSYILNYSGAPDDMVIPAILNDLNIINSNKNKEYKRNLVISVSAGMGDQLCAEPVIRYIREKEFPDANITVVSHWTRLFEHIKNVEMKKFEDYNGTPDASLVLRTCPDDEFSEHHLSHVFFHPVDFTSMSTIKKNIPNNLKDIKLGIDNNDIEEIKQLTNNFDFDKEKLILVHAGKWWESKTFPVEWWQKVVDLLAFKGNYKVCLIGKTIDEKQGYQPINCQEGIMDLRDKTSLGGLIYLISKAFITITNDSSPVHIAGAFDNWLITFATAKHSDNILPWRKGSQYYKTFSMEKKLLLDDLKVNWLDKEINTIADLPKNHNWDNYLPDPYDVLDKVTYIFKQKKTGKK